MAASDANLTKHPFCVYTNSIWKCMNKFPKQAKLNRPQWPDLVHGMVLWVFVCVRWKKWVVVVQRNASELDGPATWCMLLRNPTKGEVCILHPQRPDGRCEGENCDGWWSDRVSGLGGLWIVTRNGACEPPTHHLPHVADWRTWP